MYDVALFILFFTGVHTAVSLYWWTAFPVPYIACGAAMLLSVPRILPALRRITWRQSWAVPAYLIVAVVITLLTAQRQYLVYSIRGVGQLVYSVATAVSLYWLVLKIPRARLARVCLALLVLLTAVAVLEALGPLKGLVDTVVSWLSPNWNYSSEERDIILMGAIRSKAFAPEPSIAAVSIFWLSMMFLWSTRLGTFQMTAWMVLMAADIWAIRSPVFLLTLVCGFVLLAVRRMADPTWQKLSSWRMVPVLLAVLLNVTVLAGAFSIFYQRAISIETGEGSYIMRISGPFVFTGKFLATHPIAGVGVVGDLRNLTEEIAKAYDSLGLRLDPTESIEKAVSNRLALHFIYFGGVGSVITIALLLKASRLGHRLFWFVLLMQIVCFTLTGGGYNSAPMWAEFAALLAVARIKLAADREEIRRELMLPIAPRPTNGKRKSMAARFGVRSVFRA